MVATWLTELFLDCINRALLEESDASETSSRAQQLTNELRQFLSKHVDVLDVRTTINLLASYGRMDDLMHYASARQVSLPCQGRMSHLLGSHALETGALKMRSVFCVQDAATDV